MNDENLFERELQQGRTINSVKFESAGIDEDDDYIEFSVGFDWSAAKLNKPDS